MEPISASIVVGLLARFAGPLAEAAGSHLATAAGAVLDDELTARLRRLWDCVQARFAHDPQAIGSLQRLGEQPANPNRQAAVTDHLQELLAADPDFAARLATLTEAAQAGGGRSRDNEVLIDNSGAVATGGSVTVSGGQFAAGRDLTVGAPAAPNRVESTSRS